jgi:hypothetical protein
VKIIEYMKTTWERGEFFDPSISLFAYNETVAQEYYPISQSKAIEQWFNWTTYQVPLPKSWNIKKWWELSDRIEEVDNDVLHAAIECEVTGKLFRIQPSELVFYRKYGIPVPSKHPDQRHMERLALRKWSSYT